MSVHDNLLTGYVVDGTARQIVLHTEREGGGSQPIDVVFTGVVAYHFEADCLQNIVSEILESPIGNVIGDGTAFLSRHRSAGWPSGWDPRRETPEQFFERNGCVCFEVICSYGIGGWVAAQGMELRLRETAAQPAVSAGGRVRRSAPSPVRR